MDVSRTPIAELVPHGPRITLLDRLASHAERESVAVAEIREGGAFFESGGVPAWAGLEYMAQTIAAHAGAAARLAGERPAVGFLVGTRAYSSVVAAFPLGSRLAIRVRPLWREGGLAAFDCSIDLDGVAVATAAVTCYLPSDAELRALREPPA